MSNISHIQRNQKFQTMFLNGKTVTEISQETGWSRETVRLAVKDLPEYKNKIGKSTKSVEKQSTQSAKNTHSSPLDILHQMFGSPEQQNTCKTTTCNQSISEKEETLTAATVPTVQTKTVKWVANNNMVNLVIDGQVFVADNTNSNFSKIIEACLSEDFETAKKLLSIGKGIEEYSEGLFEFKKGNLYFAGEQINGVLVKKIIEGFSKGLDMKRYIRFIELSMENQQNSVDDMWNFLKHNDIEIDESGYIVGYKKVTDIDGTLKDSYTKTVINNLGTVVNMPRRFVNDDKNQTCSFGLHVGSMEYVKEFSGNIIIRVLVNPADVVSVPNDYNGMKMRCSQYFVQAIVDEDFNVIESQEHVTGFSLVNKQGLVKYDEI